MFDTIPNFCPLCGNFLTENKTKASYRAFCNKCLKFHCKENEFFMQFGEIAPYVRFNEDGLTLYIGDRSTKQHKIPLPNHELNYNNIVDFLKKKIQTIQLLN